MGRPKALKPILIGCACLVPVGLVVGLSVNWSHTTFIAAAGSAGARGLVYGFGKEYTKEHSTIEINAESGGAATGIRNVAGKLINIADSTSNPYYFVDKIFYDKKETKWEDMKTVTLAWEGVALIYKMPSGLSDTARQYFDISINKDNIDYLYAVFSARNELDPNFHEDFKEKGWDEVKYASYYAFLTDEAKENIKDLKDIEACQRSIIPYVKSGGVRSAGSCIAFSELSNLDDHKTEEQRNAFMGGQYGNDRHYYETEESNAQSWNMFASNDIPGQMMFVTTSFLNENNMKLINKAGYKIAKYNGLEFNIDRVCKKENGYNWFRPINSSFNLNDNLASEFIKWIFYRNSSSLSNEYKEFVKSHDMTPLDETQFATMLDGVGDKGFDISDIDLDSQRQDPYKNIYGAEGLFI